MTFCGYYLCLFIFDYIIMYVYYVCSFGVPIQLPPEVMAEAELTAGRHREAPVL